MNVETNIFRIAPGHMLEKQQQIRNFHKEGVNENKKDLLENIKSKEQDHEYQDHGAHHNNHNAMKGVFKVRLGITDQCTAVTALHMCQVFGQADMVRVQVHCGTVFNLFHPWRSWRWRKIKLWWWSTALTVPKHGLIRK